MILQIDCCRCVNLAFWQAGIPLVRRIIIANDEEITRKDLICWISAEPEFLEVLAIPAGDVEPGYAVALGASALKLSAAYLSELPAATPATLTVTLATREGEVLATESVTIDVFPPDHWLGLNVLPELLAAFVTPNLEAVTQLQTRVAHELREATGDASIQGYQSGRKRAYEICAAVYRAIAGLGIAYANPPASFATPGQPIRFADSVCRYRLGTCLDLALLFASAFEQCGLHPVIMLREGHAYVGCHLVDTHFPDLPLDDLQTIRKRVALDEFLVLETTLATKGATFAEAEDCARSRHLSADADFYCAIDVVRARYSGVKPLPIRRSTDGLDIALAGTDVDLPEAESARELQEAVDLSALEAQGKKTPGGRVAHWAQKLLDLSLRNRLLNVRDTKQVIPLVCANVAALEDKLAAGKEIRLGSISDLFGGKDIRDLARVRTGEISIEKKALLNHELERGRLWSALPPADTARRLTELYRQSRTDLEEGGVNTLFLAIGFVEWKMSEREANSHLAPILLLPVRLQRKTIAEGIRVSRIDEDTLLNQTLMELLRSEFRMTIPGLDPLPTDDSGVDVPRVLQIVRQAVKEMKGWEVREEARLGLFSFAKFTMWTDLTNRAETLKENPLVRHLIEGGGSFDDGIEVFPPEEIGLHLDLTRLYCPLNADSSQLAAILYSEAGKNFVLHGPPGTGKSQTITNIIAHNLAIGRRVLFVSEKKAALDVVHRRLTSIGLKPFCLELHSNKTAKADVVAQFAEALAVAETQPPRDWDETVRALTEVRETLNAYVYALHQPYPNGLTAYACFSRFLTPRKGLGEDLLSCDFLTQSAEDLSAREAAVADFATALADIPSDVARDLAFLGPVAWNPVVARALLASGSRLKEAFTALTGAADALTSALAIPPATTLPVLRNLSAFLTLSAELKALRERLSAFNTDRFPDVDPDTIVRRLEEAKKAFFLAGFFKKRAILKEVAFLKKAGGGGLSVAELEALLPDIRRFTAAKAEAERLAPRVSAAPGTLESLGPAFDEALHAAESALADFLPYAPGFATDADLASCCAALDALAAQGGNLRAALRFACARARADELGLGAFRAALAQHPMAPADAVESFRDAYAFGMLNSILESSPELATFVGTDRDRQIARFSELDAKWTRLVRDLVFAKLAARLPRERAEKGKHGSELGILRHECGKRMRHKPVRQLLEQIPTLAPALKPCFLMSPLSVAQYLPAHTDAFDLVVFDEASQIPVWDAIGVIARGKQVIIVGDPKQMPPTSFFQKGNPGEDAVDDGTDGMVDDMESILDECLAAGVTSTYLNWHYRSRHESLITFSNHYYYEDRLFTFPAAASTNRLGVRFEFVPDGVYDKRASRTNEREARALVDYVFRELQVSADHPRSLGIVTFSQAQKELIENLLEEERAKRPQFEAAFSDACEEPVFVKNLENVQGDERDVILFSVGYAPDKDGKFAMNFGPLNLQGGERRLNVAITRAKEQVVVFASIHAADIDLGRTNAKGAAHLKGFLDYAEKGIRPATPRAEGVSEGLADTVAKFLTERGWTVERNVGCSSYRIDVAVRDPKDPEKFVLGIECDGPSYASQVTVRDRDTLRSGVLASLGWNLCHAWSVDWAFDRPLAEAALLARLPACG